VLEGLETEAREALKGLVSRSATGAVVGVEKAEITLVGRLISWRRRAWIEPASLSGGHGLSGQNKIYSAEAVGANY
jgi:hypothetical protein